MSAAFEPSPSTQIFRAYGLEHTGELSIGSERRNARIIHLSRYDARVRLQDAPVAIATHEALLLSVNPPACLRATRNRPVGYILRDQSPYGRRPDQAGKAVVCRLFSKKKDHGMRLFPRNPHLRGGSHGQEQTYRNAG